MADSELTILIKARNTAKAEFDKLNGQVKTLQGQSGIGGLNSKLSELDGKFKSVTGVSLGFASAAGLAGMAVKGLWQFLQSSVEETVKYQSEIRDLSRLIGQDVEQTSRLVQASDDLFISQESLTTALIAAGRKGVDTSIHGIKKLSEQYNSLNPGVERAKFLTDNFGRSGAEMGKLLEQGADGIDAAMASVDESLIVTQEAITKTENYKRSVDNMNDAWAGFKMQIGQEIIPQLDLLFRVLTKGKDEVEVSEQAINRLENQISKLAGAAAMGNKSAAAKLAELNVELASLKESAYGANTDVSNLDGSMLALGTDTSNVTQYFQKLTTELLFNKIAATMTEEAAMNLAWEWGLIEPATFGAYKAIDRLTIRYDLNRDGVIDNTEATEQYKLEVLGLKNAVDGLHDKTIDVTVNTHVNGGLNLGYLPVTPELQAEGGPVSNNTPYIVGEAGPELFIPSGSGTIIPNNRLSGGGATVIVNYSPALSLSSKTEAETVLVPLIKQAMARV